MLTFKLLLHNHLLNRKHLKLGIQEDNLSCFVNIKFYSILVNNINGSVVTVYMQVFLLNFTFGITFVISSHTHICTQIHSLSMYFQMAQKKV